MNVTTAVWLLDNREILYDFVLCCIIKNDINSCYLRQIMFQTNCTKFNTDSVAIAAMFGLTRYPALETGTPELGVLLF